jgi:transcriptional regulator GlxA family with amidase domain
MTTVGILLGPGRRAFDIAVVREVYDDRSGRGLPRPDVRLLAASPVTELDELHLLRRTHDLTDLAGLDLLVVPGNEDPLAEPEPTEVAAVAEAADAGVTVASLCTGAFTLAAAGLLDGRTATTHWRFADELARRHPRVDVRPRDLYCGGDGVWTSAGVTAGIDLLLHLVRSTWGAGAAEMIARSMVTPVFRPGSQAQYADTVTPTSAAPTVERLHLAVTGELRRRWSVDDLASICSMSPRTFHRWFADRVGVPPITWLNDLRVREAQRLLEQTELSIAQVARAVGYASDDLLRKHFTARLGTTPTGHRAGFRGAVPSG